MSRARTRLLDLDAFVPRSVEVQFAGQVHRVPGAALTADLVIGLQELSQEATDGDENALIDIIDLIGRVMAQAEPPLAIRSIGPAAIGPLVTFLIEASGMTEEDEPDPPPSARRRASSTTPRSPRRTDPKK